MPIQDQYNNSRLLSRQLILEKLQATGVDITLPNIFEADIGDSFDDEGSNRANH